MSKIKRPDGLIRVSHLAGAELRYARLRDHPYGTQGVHRRISLAPGFNDRVQMCFQELWRVCPLGQAETVTTAGGYVDKPGSHGRGEAIDVDAIWWPEEIEVLTQSAGVLITRDAPDDARRYLGTEAILRSHFGGVLGWWANRAHRDHWHVDARPVGFTRYKNSSCLGFVQAACLHVHGVDPGPVDKLWGRKTRRGIRAVMGDGADLEDPGQWKEFLRLTFVEGWMCSEDPWA